MVAGEPTAFGLGPLRELAWPVTSYLAQQFWAAGFVPLGRTNVPELGTTVTTEPRSFSPARNPWDPGHSTGGSSGGSAAAVAAGTGAGCARQRRRRLHPHPGERVRAGRAQADPRAGEPGPADRGAWAGGVIDGAVARTVRDAAGVLDVISKRMPGEPYYAPALPRPLVQEVSNVSRRGNRGVSAKVASSASAWVIHADRSAIHSSALDVAPPVIAGVAAAERNTAWIVLSIFAGVASRTASPRGRLTVRHVPCGKDHPDVLVHAAEETIQLGYHRTSLLVGFVEPVEEEHDSAVIEALLDDPIEQLAFVTSHSIGYHGEEALTKAAVPPLAEHVLEGREHGQRCFRDVDQLRRRPCHRR